MTPELLKSEADNCDAQSGLYPVTLLGCVEKHQRKFDAITSEIDAVKKHLHHLSQKAKRIFGNLSKAKERANGIDNTSERIKLTNEKTKSTATLHCERWSDEDVAFVLEHKGKMTHMELARHLGRTRLAIKSRFGIIKKAEQPNIRS